MSLDYPLLMPSDAELLKAYLADRDVPCPGCGYSLKGCVAEQCPECGHLARLAVERGNERIGPFVIGLSGIVFGLGLYLPMLCYMLLRMRQSTARMIGMRPEEYVIIAAVVTLSVALVLWLAQSSSIMRATSRRAGISAAVLAVICGCSPAVFIVMIL